MSRNIVIKLLLMPLSLIYGLVIGIRSILYKVGLLTRIAFDVPIISVGNLTIGGAGKTPHIEHLIRLLQPFINVATLSRGYKRKTKGYLEVHPNHTSDQTGDEPLQFKRKYPNIKVVVCENRVFGVPKIMSHYPDTQTILLDDAFQHLPIIPGLNILLTDYALPYNKDFLLPSGRLREWTWAAERADTIIVSKCPPDLTIEKANTLKTSLNILPHQSVYFSQYAYRPIYPIFNGSPKRELNEDLHVLLVCAIAGTTYLMSYLEDEVDSIKLLEFEDHHEYTPYDMSMIKKYFDSIPHENKIILSTEKDAIRFQMHHKFITENNLNIYALPIEVDFLFDEQAKFNNEIKSFLLNFKA